MPPSASDFTRFKRLTGAGSDGLFRIDVVHNTDMQNFQTPSSCAATGCSSRATIRRDQDQAVGMGRTRREASKWTDFVASQQADFVTVSQIPGLYGSYGRQLTESSLCGGVNANGYPCPPSSLLRTGPGIKKSAVYQHLRIL